MSEHRRVLEIGRAICVMDALQNAYEIDASKATIAIPESVEGRQAFKLTVATFLLEIGLSTENTPAAYWKVMEVTDPAWEAGQQLEQGRNYQFLTPESELNLDSRVIVFPMMRGG